MFISNRMTLNTDFEVDVKTAFRCNTIPAIALRFVALELVADVDCVRIALGESPCQQPA